MARLSFAAAAAAAAARSFFPEFAFKVAVKIVLAHSSRLTPRLQADSGGHRASVCLHARETDSLACHPLGADFLTTGVADSTACDKSAWHMDRLPQERDRRARWRATPWCATASGRTTRGTSRVRHEGVVLGGRAHDLQQSGRAGAVRHDQDTLRGRVRRHGAHGHERPHVTGPQGNPRQVHPCPVCSTAWLDSKSTLQTALQRLATAIAQLDAILSTQAASARFGK